MVTDDELNQLDDRVASAAYWVPDQVHARRSIVVGRFSVVGVKSTAAAKYPHKNEHGQTDYQRGEPYLAATVDLSAVKHGTFGDASPSGTVQMMIMNERAAKVFADAIRRGVEVSRERGAIAQPTFRVYFVLEDPELA